MEIAVSIGYELPLFPLQAKAHNKVIYRLGEGEPSIIWAGRQAGKTEICRRVSHAFEAAHQVGISYSPEHFEDFLIEDYDHFHPAEVTLEFGAELEPIWEALTPQTVVFIDNLFELPFAEELFYRIAHVTPHIVAMTSIGIEDSGWDVSKTIAYMIGPYATWEMNPMMDQEALRESRSMTPGDRRKFNDELLACVNTKYMWKDWACKTSKS
jgi:hypothetical protein